MFRLAILFLSFYSTYADFGRCEDINECTDKPCNNANTNSCENKDPGYTCHCKPGFEGVHCDNDINECAGVTCGGTSTCVNGLNKYTCNCATGWQGGGVNNVCTYIDKCAGVTCGGTSTCVNDHIKYTCECATGWQGGGVNNACTDIDECALGTDDCSEHATCTNTAGGFECNCKSGFSGLGKNCYDINECRGVVPPCGTDTCVNSVGSYECHETGWECWHHFGCSPQSKCSKNSNNQLIECTCLPGFEGDGYTCEDIDECADETDDCSEHANCTNTAASFECACKPGFIGNGAICLDFNECAYGTDDCSVHDANCVNTVGNFECHRFGLDCDTFGCSEHAKCVIQNGNFTECRCNLGFEGDGVTCVINDNVDGTYNSHDNYDSNTGNPNDEYFDYNMGGSADYDPNATNYDTSDAAYDPYGEYNGSGNGSSTGS